MKSLITSENIEAPVYKKDQFKVFQQGHQQQQKLSAQSRFYFSLLKPLYVCIPITQKLHCFFLLTALEHYMKIMLYLSSTIVLIQ